MATWNLAIKMGTSITSIFLSGNGIVLSEPTMIAFSNDRRDRRIRAVGSIALEMLGKAPETTTIVAPVVDGIIADRSLAYHLLYEFITRLLPSDAFKPKINAIMAVPTGLTLDERRMYEDICFRAGINNVTLVDNIMLAALGIDLPVEHSMGRLIVNIGAGITEIGAISNCGVVTGCSINIGGNMIDRALLDYIAGQYNLRISISSARKIKTKVGSLYFNDRAKVRVDGLDITTNNLAAAEVTARDVMDTAMPYYTRIVEALEGIINICPPDIAGDINRTGIYLTGGSSKILGLDRLFSQNTGLKVNITEKPEFAAIMGAGKLLSNERLLNEILKVK